MLGNHDYILSSAKLIAEDKKIEFQIALRIAKFKFFAKLNGFKVSLWCKVGVRLYFVLPSQNNHPAIFAIKKIYYDPQKNDIFLIFGFPINQTRSFNKVLLMASSGFSGARTRETIKTIARSFYAEKILW